MKFRQESSTPLHSKHRRRRKTWIRNILKSTACSLRKGASFQANLASIRGETAELHACQKVPTDRQTAFRLYIVYIYLYIIFMYVATYVAMAILSSCIF